MSEHALKLCFVTEAVAWFTTQPLSLQWGDDWKDAPFEHNAGCPYSFSDYDAKRGRSAWAILKIAWEGPFGTPAEHYRWNSPLSVQQINAGAAPWLLAPPWESHNTTIPAGACLCQFIRLLRAEGGTVYLPLECPPCESFEVPA